MQTVRLRTIVPKDRRIEISLPPETPEGPAEVLVVVEPTAGAPSADSQSAMRQTLLLLRRLRAESSTKELRLSEAVIDERRSEA